MNSLVSFFAKFWSKPFNPDGDAVSWILFLGFILIVMIGWSSVIGKIATE